MVPDLDISLLKAFVTVAEERNVTAAGRRLGRSQPAVTLQIKRLEQSLGRLLFDRRGHRLTLTRDGEDLLPYARAILKTNDEARARLSRPDLSGHVILGTPDLYAAYLLPEVLADFGRAYPRIEIELRCALSSALHQAVRRGDVDLALVTRVPKYPDGVPVRREALVWVGHPDLPIHKEAILPLAMLPSGNLYRDLALESLDRAGRRWRIACSSESIGGLQAAVFAGLAVSVLTRPAVINGMRPLGATDGMPALPSVDLVLQQKPGRLSDASNRLASYILERIGTEPADRARKFADVRT